MVGVHTGEQRLRLTLDALTYVHRDIVEQTAEHRRIESRFRRMNPLPHSLQALIRRVLALLFGSPFRHGCDFLRCRGMGGMGVMGIMGAGSLSARSPLFPIPYSLFP